MGTARNYEKDWEYYMIKIWFVLTMLGFILLAATKSIFLVIYYLIAGILFYILAECVQWGREDD